MPYCSVYDSAGRELLPNNLKRRVIGYFTSWRTGKNGQPAYLPHQIPWQSLSHINYAFAHVGPDNKISVGNTSLATNAATGLTWPGVPGAEMDPNLPYNGLFNLINRYKQQHPGVKTLISVGGWAETGGYFDDNGERVASGGFYTMTQSAAGIETFANSVVTFLRQYQFDGVDIDYEYPTTMSKAGNPLDWQISEQGLSTVVARYNELMRVLRKKLDEAGRTDGKYYLLTIAAPSSGYLLRGMENFESLKYLDFVNVMSYDLHGAWNEFVGPNAALFDDGRDAELVRWNVYNSPQYGGIGYLNTDWAYHYFRGAMPAGRINIGVPYYTRGWKNVTGGSNGLWGKAVGSNCPIGLDACGDGARGIDNLWHDLENQLEVGAGSNPLWHALNLKDGKIGSYAGVYGLDPVNDPEDRLTGVYQRFYDQTLVAPWLWNAEKKVFLSIEDSESIARKAQWVVNNNVGGVMFWELAGDYAYHADRGEYFMGATLTNQLANAFKQATPYGNKLANITMPSSSIDVKFDLHSYALGDSNYPITPKLKITNNSMTSLPGGTEFQFDIPTSMPADFVDQSGFGTQVISVGHSGPNAGSGLTGEFHRVSLKLPGWQTLAPGQSVDVTVRHYLPGAGPSNFTVTVSGTKYATRDEHPELPVGVQ